MVPTGRLAGLDGLSGGHSGTPLSDVDLGHQVYRWFSLFLSLMESPSMTKYVREFFSAVNHSASLDNRFGHKMLAVCYGVIIFGLWFSMYLDMTTR
jgi:hypothetical protein